MKLLRLLAVPLFLLLPSSLHAQLGIYGSFTASKLNALNNDNYIYGGTFGAYLASGTLALLSVGVDLRGSFQNGGGTGFDSGAIGPRVALNLHLLPIHPYVEAMGGIGHVTFAGAPENDVTKFEYQFLGGVDFTVFPRLDWRVAEFSYGGFSGLNSDSFHPKSFSTGLVLRLPNLVPRL